MSQLQVFMIFPEEEKSGVKTIKRVDVISQVFVLAERRR